MRPRIYLIDGAAVVYRSYYAFIKRPLINSRGQNTSALFGVVNTFLRLIEKFRPEHIAVVFDRKEPTFRHQLDTAYKANRPPMPEDLVSQLAPISEFFRRIGVPEYSLPGFEADDLMATIAARCKADYDVILVTGDKDFCQLVEDGVTVFDPFKEIELDPAAVTEKYGLTPEQFVDYLALVGDASDNIPGAMGIGPMTAVKLLTEFFDLDTLYASLERVKPDSVRQKLEASRDKVFLSRTLAQIVRDAPMEAFSPEALRFEPVRLSQARPLLEQYELNSLVKRLPADIEPDLFAMMGASESMDAAPTEPEKTAPGFEWRLVNRIDEFNAILDQLRAHDPISIDTETTSLDPLTAELVGVSLCWEASGGVYLSVGHELTDNLPPDPVIAGLREVLKDKTLIAHNWKYDALIFEQAGWKPENRFFDTMIAAYLVEPGEYNYKLDNCAYRELGRRMIPITDLIGSGKNQITFDLADPEKAAEYSVEDAVMAFRLHEVYAKRLRELELENVFDGIEIPLVPVLAEMEKTGVYIDVAALHEISKRTQEQIAILIRRIHEMAGEPFNLNSTQQLGKILFETLGLPSGKRTKTGWSTDNEVLEKLAVEHEIARLLIEYRQLAKLESTYTTALPRLVNPFDGRVHSSFNQTVASTGRLSSTNPNLQNIPVRTPLGREIRKAFVPGRPSWKILSADYSQIELRILAMLSQDPNLVSAFRSGDDIHARTAARIFNLEPAQVTADERRKAKIINFGILYGMGPVRLSTELEIPQKEARAFIDHYFDTFPTIRDFLRHLVLSARQKGYAETMFGRKLFLPDLHSTNQRLLGDAERIAVNMPIQGGAADLIKRAMIDLHARISGDSRIRMLIQVHDELVFEVEESFITEATRIVRECMTGALPPRYSEIVPLTVETGVGDNWKEAH
jgi:DNA polymerase I